MTRENSEDGGRSFDWTVLGRWAGIIVAILLVLLTLFRMTFVNFIVSARRSQLRDHAIGGDIIRDDDRHVTQHGWEGAERPIREPLRHCREDGFEIEFRDEDGPIRELERRHHLRMQFAEGAPNMIKSPDGYTFVLKGYEQFKKEATNKVEF